MGSDLGAPDETGCRSGAPARSCTIRPRSKRLMQPDSQDPRACLSVDFLAPKAGRDHRRRRILADLAYLEGRSKARPAARGIRVVPTCGATAASRTLARPGWRAPWRVRHPALARRSFPRTIQRLNLTPLPQAPLFSRHPLAAHVSFAPRRRYRWEVAVSSIRLRSDRCTLIAAASTSEVRWSRAPRRRGRPSSPSPSQAPSAGRHGLAMPSLPDPSASRAGS